MIEPNLPGLSVARLARGSAQPGLVRRHHIHADVTWLPLFGRHHGLAYKQGSGVAYLEHAGGRLLHRSPERGHPQVRASEIRNADRGSQFTCFESTFSYFEALDLYLAAHGRPVAFYSDKHSVFRVANQSAKSGHGMTQFGRALNGLNVEILCANSSMAKGRVERANRTLKDRLVKELRLAGICDTDR